MTAREINKLVRDGGNGVNVYAQGFADVETPCWVRIIRAKVVGGVLLLKNINGHWMHTHSGTQIKTT
jgi:hypothetical protein